MVIVHESLQTKVYGFQDMVEKIIRPRMEHDHPAWEAYVREQAKKFYGDDFFEKNNE